MTVTTVLKQGTKVKIKLGSVSAEITAIIIRHYVVLYELIYFSNGEFDYITLSQDSFEILDNADFLNIGFK